VLEVGHPVYGGREWKKEVSMPGFITRDEVKELLDRGAQLVEVLPREEYEDEHLPGAINIPLRQIDQDARDRLDPSRPVVLYCWDHA
jgi:rhodanese-related sulfurtransferase